LFKNLGVVNIIFCSDESFSICDKKATMKMVSINLQDWIGRAKKLLRVPHNE
jgi:hypothetical protein